MKFSQLKLTTPYLNLDPIFFDEVEPAPLKNPFLISTSKEAAKLLGLENDIHVDEKLVDIVNGTYKLDGSKTFAMCYAGHQFGYFVPRLGDGRAINLDKVNGLNLQLKGAGQTLYSRQGDGRAVLRSSIREYLMSEAMHGLGIQTSRALALIGSDTDVARERWEKGAIVLRLSSIVNYEAAIKVLDESFGLTYEEEYLSVMYKKMGLHVEDEKDIELFKWMLGALESATIDYTLFFRTLSRYDGDKRAILELAVFQNPLKEWLEAYDKRVAKESFSQEDRHKQMLAVNPKYILKNHILQEAIEKAEISDFSMIDDLLTVALNPFAEHEALNYLSKTVPQKAKNIKLSCSS